MGKRSYGPLPHATGYCAQAGVDFAWRRTEDEGDNGIPGDFDVLEGAEDVDFSACEVAVRLRNECGDAEAYVSARTIRVRLAFSMVNLVFPS